MADFPKYFFIVDSMFSIHHDNKTDSRFVMDENSELLIKIDSNLLFTDAKGNCLDSLHCRSIDEKKQYVSSNGFMTGVIDNNYDWYKLLMAEIQLSIHLIQNNITVQGNQK